MNIFRLLTVIIRRRADFNRHSIIKHRFAKNLIIHLMPKSLLIEAGAQTNTVEEMMNAMEVLSNMLYDVLVEE